MFRFWTFTLHGMYWLLAMMDPLIRWFWRGYGLGNVVEFRVPTRGGGVRSRMLGILRADGRLYVGHPNGPVGWTRDLDAAGRAIIVWPGGELRDVRADRLPAGIERGAAIRATGQHPFPGNLIYRLARRHVGAVGVYFRITPIDAAAEADGAPPTDGA